jgi:hypothetical protein
MRACTKVLLVVGATAAAVAGRLCAQPGIASTEADEQLRQQISELQIQTGLSRPVELIDPLRALAMLYQEAGRDELASATFEEARYVARIHHGLASAEEALLLRQQIRSEKQLGNNQRIWDLEQDMVTMARQHHDDIRMLPIFNELAEDRLSVIEQVRAGRRPPIVFIGCYYGAARPRYDDARGERRPPDFGGPENVGAGPSCMGGSMAGILNRLRNEILMYYADAIEVILRTGDYASEDLRQLERAALRLPTGRGGPVQYGEPGGSFAPCFGGTLDAYIASDILRSCLAPVGRGPGWVVANVGSRTSLIRLISYEVRTGAPAATRANAVAELADWHILAVPPDRRRFDLSQTTFSLYERAYRETRQNAVLQTEMFAPELPLTLPTYEPNPLASTASSRYIEAAFDVTRYGTAQGIEILDTTKDATREEKRDLIRLLESTTFRPRMVDGKVADEAPVVLRYHLP